MRCRLTLILAFILSIFSQHVSAQQPSTTDEYPSRQIRIIVPTSAGSAIDIVARVVSQSMETTLGQTFVVENQPGASGIIAMATASRAEPDGYNIIITNGNLVTVIPNMKTVSYDPVKSFSPISGLAKISLGLISNPVTGPNSVAELIARARQSPKAMNYGTGGPGSPQHIAMELFMRAANIRLTHVPYRNVSGAINDVIGGQIPVMFTALSALPALVKDNKVRLLGISSPERNPMFPDTPTVGEQGLPTFSYVEWCAFLAPSGTPPEIVETLNKATLAALADQKVQEKLRGLGFMPYGSSPKQLAAVIAEGVEEMRKLVRSAGIRE